MDRLSNTVRPYAWGSTTAIPELLGIEPMGEPQAELWMGAHPSAPSRIDRGSGPVSLADVISADPVGELGRAVAERFGGRLPFLFKVLAPESPLSLQVHPDLQQAIGGYLAEEERGIPLDAPHRNYKDANHKPELVCALEPFEGLCGFRPAEQAADLLEGLGVKALKPYVDILRAQPEADALREVLTAVLTADKNAIGEIVQDAAVAAERLAARARGGAGAEDGGAEVGPFTESYAAYAAIARSHPRDPGVLAAMLLNHVRLQPGEALFLGAGVPHAYLSGLSVEIMANSDNVLRCGLTPKHVDIDELLRVVDFRSMVPGVLRPEADEGGEEVYPAPVEEFRLSRFVLDGGAPSTLNGRTVQILLCTAGSARLRRGSKELTLARGESVFIPAGPAVALDGTGTVFRATVAV